MKLAQSKFRLSHDARVLLFALLGGLPLALGTGTGSELHRPLGITIVGGLIVSQALTLFTTPVVYVYLDRFRLWQASLWRRARQNLAAESGD